MATVVCHHRSMALHRPSPSKCVIASIGLGLVAVGCVGTSGPVAVPGATVAPTTIEPVVEAADTTPTTPAAAPETEPPATTPPTSAPVVTDPSVTTPPTTEPAATTTPAPSPDQFLRIGDEGDEVSIFQLKLRALGYLEPGYADGLFDRATADALIEFQAQYGLVVDGIFGPETDRSLSAAAASVNVDG